MPKKTKKFIDRKSAVTFHLVHRSQQDPLTADEAAPQRVLLPVKENLNKANSSDVKKRIEEQQKFGIFFDDDYNYLQHLRDVNKTFELVQEQSSANMETQTLQLPSSVFASNVEEEIGLLNKAAPHTGLRLDLDPDVIAAMDEDFDFDDPENELEDNFMELANAEGLEEEEEDEYEDDGSSDYVDSEGLDEVGSLDGPQFTFRDEETKSRFTDYSMSSSVIRRNEQLTLLDDRFEKIYSGYDDNEIGALDCDEIEGYVPETSEVLLQYADEFEKSRQKEKLDKDSLALRMRLEQECGSDEEDKLMSIEIPKKEKWDCESILSTYSNIYNHPKLISEPKKSVIKINMRTGMPVNILNGGKLTAQALSRLNEQHMQPKKGPESVGVQSVISNLSMLSVRRKDESTEQRKVRKRLLREYRKERRQEKKLNSQAFKEEAKKQVKIVINNQKNVQGNKIL